VTEGVDHSAWEQDFSDLYEKSLPPARAKELEDHLASCDRCRAEYEKFREALGALSGLHKMSAPQAFDEQVAKTIHKRSGGRFFGRKAFGDRVPFELLALFGLVLVVFVYVLLRWSVTGAVHEPLKKSPHEIAPDPNIRRVLPPP
jgi:anti-sigma factor RsiW